MAIQLKLATPLDARAIRDLTREAYARWVALIGREPGPMTADSDVLVHQDRFDLLLDDGVLAALIQTRDEGEQILIENVAVSPPFQRQGLGRRLLSHAEGVARDLGRTRMRLYTNQRFTENIRLYQRLGYVIDRAEDVAIGVRIHMSKALGVSGA